MTINTLTVVMPAPPDPALDNSDTYAQKASAFTQAMKQLGDQLTSIIPQMNNDIATTNTAANTAVNAPGTAGTSTTSLTIGSGTQTFTTQTGKNWQVGQPVVIASSASPANWMAGTIAAYNSSTGAMTVSTSVSNGSGTFASWVVALCGPVTPVPQSITTTAGTSTAYTLAPSPAITSYQAGQSWMVQFHATCGDNPTISINGVAAPPNLVKLKGDGSYGNIKANELPANLRARVTLISATQAVVEGYPFVKPAFSAYLGSTQSGVASNAPTKVAINVENFDTNNCFDAATNFRFQPNVPGYYNIKGAVQMLASGGGSGFTAYIYKNGAAYSTGNAIQVASTNSAQTMTVSDLVYLNGSTDYIELYGSIVGTTNSFYVTSVSNTSRLSGEFVRGE